MKIGEIIISLQFLIGLIGLLFAIEIKPIYNIIYFIILMLILAYTLSIYNLTYITYVLILVYATALAILFALIIMLEYNNKSNENVVSFKRINYSLNNKSLIKRFSYFLLLTLFIFLPLLSFNYISESFIPFLGIENLDISFNKSETLDLIGNLFFFNLGHIIKFILLTFFLLFALIVILYFFFAPY